jgi:CrcB protein
MMLPLLIAVAGGLGAVARFMLDGFIRARVPSSYPVGTILINVSGSLLLGLVLGATAGRLLPETLQLVVGTGFLGGYTTFSTAAVETVVLAQRRRWAAAVFNGLGMLVLAAAAAGLGWWIGAQW